MLWFVVEGMRSAYAWDTGLDAANLAAFERQTTAELAELEQRLARANEDPLGPLTA
jgi:hypothetical protein